MSLGRRAFIRLIPLGLAAALAGGSWWFFREVAREPVKTSQATVTSTSEESAATTSSVFDFPVTWNGDGPTHVNIEDYRLRVDGDVSKPLQLTVVDLYAMSSVQRTLRIECVLGWAADVPWDGIPLPDLLRLAGASEKVASVTIESVTGYKITMNSDEVANPDNMIALKAGGLPLTVEHGYPARLVAPTRSGLDWVKYVHRITCASR